MDYNFVKFVEKFGCVDEHGHHLYGTAALLHVLSCPICKISSEDIKCRKVFVEKYITA